MPSLKDNAAERLGHEPPRYSFEATAKQQELMGVIASGEFTIVGFGGGIRGTKTWGALAAIITLCKVYPGSRWAIVRTDLPTLRRNTIPSFNKLRALARNFVGEINQSTWSAKCANGSEIIFFPEQFDRDPDLDRWKGLEVNGFLFEEANEMNEKSFYKGIERAGSWIIPPTEHNPNPAQPKPYLICTFNPAANWVKRKFYDPWKAGTIKKPYYFLPTTIADNPYASDDYKESLKNLPPDEYRRFVEGDWEATDDPDQLIKAEWVFGAQQGVIHDPLMGPRMLGVDVARYGDDQTVFCGLTGNGMEFMRVFDHVTIDRVADMTRSYITDPDIPIDDEYVKIDAVGLGAGVADILTSEGFKVSRIISGAKPLPRPGQIFGFANLRSQMWWEFREKLRAGIFSLPENIDPKLLNDLTAPRYQIKSDKVIQVESKSDIKLRLGRSTDLGDALVYAAFDMPRRKAPRIAPSISNRNLRR